METKDSNRHTLWSNQYESDESTNPAQSNITIYKFKIGDMVKISYLKNLLIENILKKWTTEIFTVMSRKKNQDIPIYQLKDFNNDIIGGYLYEPEMQISYKGDDVYKVEKILKNVKEKYNRGLS